MIQEDNGDSNTGYNKGGYTPINGVTNLGDCYLEILKFDLGATKKKSDAQVRDALLITKLVG